MTHREADIVVVGAGAAGIAAARRLQDAGADYLLVEARTRLGGRSLTAVAGGHPVDLGCGWLHSGDRNPWREVAEAQGRAIDKTPPPWTAPANSAGFPLAEQEAFSAALESFHDRMHAIAQNDDDQPASQFLEPSERWNPLIDAVNTYVSGAELADVSARDLLNYSDSGVNWRVRDGYGTVIAAHAAPLRVLLNCPVQRIDASGRRLRIETRDGAIEARAVIVTLPSSLLAARPEFFYPALPEKTEAAAGLPLGLDDKLFLSLSSAEEFDADSRLFGCKDRTATGVYHLRPFGRPQIECYFGGTCAEALEAGGADAFFDFASGELAGLLGNDFRRRIAPLGVHAWRADPFARGAYSYALPGKTGCRAQLAAPVDGRLFFAGEACSQRSYSTAHGAYLTGIAAADQAIAARRTS